jgi:hypothetical protein
MASNQQLMADWPLSWQRPLRICRINMVFRHYYNGSGKSRKPGWAPQKLEIFAGRVRAPPELKILVGRVRAPPELKILVGRVRENLRIFAGKKAAKIKILTG